MIKIQNEHLEQYAKEHYKQLKNKLKNFPTNCKYSLEEVITANPEKLDEIVKWTEEKDKVSDYKFMIDKYKNFTTKKKEYNAYDLAKKLKQPFKKKSAQ